MKRSLNKSKRGATMLEFVMVSIPLIFILISLFEIARGMWNYQSLAYGVREGARYAAMHGKDCASPNTCLVSIGNITTVIQNAAVGIDPSTVTLTFTPASGTATTDTMTNLATNTTKFPPSTAYAQGQTVTISGKYAFRSILSIFWVGDGRPLVQNGTFYLTAASAEPIQY